jgi:hypothetical protein
LVLLNQLLVQLHWRSVDLRRNLLVDLVLAGLGNKHRSSNHLHHLMQASAWELAAVVHAVGELPVDGESSRPVDQVDKDKRNLLSSLS